MHTPIRSLAFALALVSACGGSSPEGQLKAAEDHLAAGAFDQAATVATEGLAANPSDVAIRWRLEFALLEAQARGGDVAATTATLATSPPPTSSRAPERAPARSNCSTRG
jgi:hypothetical protein